MHHNTFTTQKNSDIYFLYNRILIEMNFCFWKCICTLSVGICNIKTYQIVLQILLWSLMRNKKWYLMVTSHAIKMILTHDSAIKSVWHYESTHIIKEISNKHKKFQHFINICWHFQCIRIFIQWRSDKNANEELSLPQLN